MTFDSHIYLDGVDFKFSDFFTSRTTVNLPDGFDLKDPEILLEDLQYDFTRERQLTEDLRQQRLNEEKRNQLEKQERERQRQELALKHKQYLQEKEEKLKEEIENNSQIRDEFPKPMKISPGNPFFNDITGNTILTPQPVYPPQKPDVVSPYNNLDINDFETNNLDPFSNMELRTLDDMKELEDVLQKVTRDNNTRHIYTEPSVSPNNQTHHSIPTPNNNNNHVVIETAIKPPEDQPSTSQKKRFVLDEFTDILTADCENKLSEDVNQTKPVPLPRETNSNLQFLSPDLNEKSNSPSTELPRSSPVPNSDTSTTTMVTSQSVPLLRKKLASPVTVLDSNTVAYQKPSKNNSLPDIAAQTIDNNKTGTKSPEFEIKPRKLAPIPKPRPQSKSPRIKENAVAKKSANEKAKFEETIIKALTSLPQLPNPKPLTKQTVPPIVKHRSSSLMEGLTAEEREFISSFVEMGFQERDVIRSMQKYGQDQKQVLNHLCAVQNLCEEGFETSNIEEVMEMFTDESEVKNYLTLQRQFLDMGFSCEKINQAMLLNDKDHTKTLDALMAES